MHDMISLTTLLYSTSFAYSIAQFLNQWNVLSYLLHIGVLSFRKVS